MRDGLFKAIVCFNPGLISGPSITIYRQQDADSDYVRLTSTSGIRDTFDGLIERARYELEEREDSRHVFARMP